MSCYGGCGNQYYDYYMKPQMQGMYPQMQGMYPMQDTQNMDLEVMYPQVYHKIYPAVKGYCDMMGIKPGMTVSPTKEQLDGMVENIYTKVDPEIEMSESDMVETEPTRQLGLGFGVGGFGRRRFLRDVIGILLIRELLRRRHGYGGYGGYGDYGGYGY